MGLLTDFVPIADFEEAYRTLLTKKKTGTEQQMLLSAHMYGPIPATARPLVAKEAVELIRRWSACSGEAEMPDLTLGYIKVAEPEVPYTKDVRLRTLLPFEYTDKEARKCLSGQATKKLWADPLYMGTTASLSRLTLAKSKERPPRPCRVSTTEEGAQIAVWTATRPPEFFETKEEARERALCILANHGEIAHIGRVTLLELWKEDAPLQQLWYAVARFKGFKCLKVKGVLFFMSHPSFEVTNEAVSRGGVERVSSSVSMDGRG